MADVCKVVCFNERKIEGLRRHVPDQADLQKKADRWKAMGHPGRIAVLHILAIEECCVCDLANVLEHPVSTISQHLQTLKAAGLVRSRQEGKLVFYSLVDNPVLLQASAIAD